MVWTQEQRDKWRQNNREREKEQQNQYNKTPTRKKTNTISNWKKGGLEEHGYTYDEVYEYYLETTHCEVCNKDLSTTQKCMDHCHTDGCFRWVLCKSCNSKDSWMKKI